MTNAVGGFFVLALAMPPAVPAQMGAGGGMAGYDRSAEITVQGTVQEVKEHRHAGQTGIHAVVKTDQGAFDVHLGPSSFLAGKQLDLRQGDQIQVTGSRVKMNGTDALLAREVRKGGTAVALRNEQGVPLWSGGAMGGGQMGHGMMHGRGMPARMYNPAAESSVTGTVTELLQCPCGRRSGTIAMLNTGQETVEVHLGPQAFLAQKNLTIRKGDRLQITGSRINFDGQDMLLAREVRKNGATVALRTAEGVPLWPAGMGRGRAARGERPPVK